MRNRIKNAAPLLPPNEKTALIADNKPNNNKNMKKTTLFSNASTQRALLASPMTKRLILASVASIAAISFGLQTALAQTYTIGFETSEGYASAAGGPVAFTSGTPVNNATASIPFGLPNGNAQGWTASSSTTAGELVATISSGSYVGGQALGGTTGTPSGATTYIGALNLGFTSGFTSLMFDVMSPALVSDQAAMGGWYDANADGTYNQTPETGVVGGIVGGNFGIRQANFGTTYSSGVAPTAGDWYQVTLAYNYVAASSSLNSATLNVYNLTTGRQVNLGGTGGDFTEVGATLFDNGANVAANPATYQGIYARVTGDGLIDNIGVTAAPEPTSIAMLSGGLCLLFGLRCTRRFPQA